MRQPFLAALLIGAASLAGAGAQAAVIAPATGKAIMLQSEAVAPAREAGEGPRREDRRLDRRNDRRNDRREDRRTTSLEQPGEAPLLLVREAGEGPRREDRRLDRRNDRRNDRREDRRTTTLEQPADGLLVLVREGSSRNRGRRGV